MDRSVALLVPRRTDGGHRDRLWDYVRDRLIADWRIVEGHHDHGEFSRACALNTAAGAAWDAEVLVVMDSDTVVAPEQIASAVDIARATGIVTFAFGRYVGLTEPGTAKILDGYDGTWEPFVDLEFENTASSCLAVRRDLWETVGGFDERFVGWGFEDVAFSLACQSIGGGMHRVEGTAWHLWHEPSPHTGDQNSVTWQRNRDLCQPYRDVGWDDHDGMLALITRLRAES